MRSANINDIDNLNPTCIHAYHIIYIISVIPAGMLLMYAYIVRQKKNDAFLSVYSIHLICNIIALILKLTN